MSFDSKIKRELENDAAEIDRILAQENTGLASMLSSSFKGSMKRWFILINAVAIAITIVLVGCAYKFFTVDSGSQMFWGILFLACLQLQISTKQWITNEMNRASLIREIKRLELSINELEDRVNESNKGS